MPKSALVSRPGVEAAGRLAHRAVQFGIGDGRRDCDCYGLGNLVLQCENIGNFAIVTVGPDMFAGLGLDQLRGDADAVADPAQAGFEDVTHTPFAPYWLQADRRTLVREASVARDYEPRRES